MNTMQQEFDAVVAHLYKQGFPAKMGSTSATSYCAYRGDNGAMCAVGCRIPDEKYSSKMEGNSLGDLLQYLPGAFTDEIVAYATMFSKLQEVHDQWDFTGYDASMTWEEYLDVKFPEVAEEFNLTFTKPEA